MPYSTPQVDTTKLIWESLFLCKIPNLQTMSEEYIKFFGIPTTGDAGIDNELANEWITTMLTIAKMVEYHKEGIGVQVLKKEDVKTIYENITLHLAAWKKQLDYGVNNGNAPLDDLIAMDEFANSVYEHVKFYPQAEIEASSFVKQMSATVNFNKASFFKKPLFQTNEDGSIKEELLPQRKSLSDIFKERVTGARKWN